MSRHRDSRVLVSLYVIVNHWLYLEIDFWHDFSPVWISWEDLSAEMYQCLMKKVSIEKPSMLYPIKIPRMHLFSAEVFLEKFLSHQPDL